jgi:hypothetical protein
MGNRSDKEDCRWIWEGNEAQGPYSIPALFKMATSGDIAPATLFWSESSQAWKQLSALLFDLEPSRLSQMASAGIKRVKVLGCGDDCEACAAFAGKVYSISSPPSIPPVDCQCVPWCRLVFAAVE